MHRAKLWGNRRACRWTDRGIDAGFDGQADRELFGKWMDGSLYGRTDGEMDGLMGRQGASSG